MKNNIVTLLFAFVLGIICASLLVTANIVTGPYKKANERAEEIKNILSVMEVPVPEGADANSFVEIYKENIRKNKLGDYIIYEYFPGQKKSSNPEAISIQFSGPGLWGGITGVISFLPDLLTINKISFYKQEETPGLGGEIGADWFQNQFKGKKIVSESGKPGFKIIKPGSSIKPNINSVDGITAATMTSDRVQAILEKLAIDIYKERENYGR